MTLDPVAIQQWTALFQAAIPLGVVVFNAVQQAWYAHKAENQIEDNGQLDVVIAGCKEHIARIEAEETAEAAAAKGQA